jgi:hypothetical protein
LLRQAEPDSPSELPRREMSEASDFNARIIDEFRANAGKVGGMFEGIPLLLLHHTGASLLVAPVRTARPWLGEGVDRSGGRGVLSGLLGGAAVAFFLEE